MNKSEMVQSLWDRIKQPKHTMAMLSQIFEEYKATVAEFIASDPQYQQPLRHTHEEFPDLSRLIGRGHDAILKGRLIDAIGALKQKVAMIESPPEETASPTDDVEKSGADSPIAPENSEPEKPRFRNMPSLGMD